MEADSVRSFLGSDRFSCTMGTGITSILLHELPYQFKGLKNVANVRRTSEGKKGERREGDRADLIWIVPLQVIFVFNIVLFLAILGMSW